MIKLLFSVIFGEMILILAFLFKSPFRELAILTLDRVKRGSGPFFAMSVAAAIFLDLSSSLNSMVKILQRYTEAGAINPTDQVLMSKHLLEASLNGFILFLGLMIDRLHHYIRELRSLRKTMEAIEKPNSDSDETKGLAEQIAPLNQKIKQLESECNTKSEEDVKAAEATVTTLKKQSLDSDSK